jgi:undecaprenyl diphosphate synthase
MEITAKNTGLTMVLALSYSSEWELTKAVKEIATSVKNGELATEEISGETIAITWIPVSCPTPTC